MSVFTSATFDKSPVQYLFEGLLPNLARYLAGGPRHGTEQLAQVDLPKDNAEGTTKSVLPIEAQSSAAGKMDTTAHVSRSEQFASFDLPSVKRSNRRSLPVLALPHARNVSTSSDETLVGSPSGPPTSTPTAASHVDQDLRDAAERVVRQKQADEIQRLEEVAGELRREKDGETQRAEGLQKDLAVSEANRKKNLDMAIQHYKKQGNPFLVELESQSEYIEEMRREIESKENLIKDRDEVIEALERDVDLYADRDHWILMQQRFYDLQQQYGQMPAALRSLERTHGNLEDDYVDLYRIVRNREADLTVLRAQLSQVQDERDQFELDASVAEEQSEDAVSRYRRMEVERNQFLDQKAESEEQAGAKERLLADVASRLFKRTIIMADTLDDLGVDPVDEELISLCQLVHEHLGVDAKDVYKDVELAKAKGKRDGGAGEVGHESGVAKAHAGAFASSPATNLAHQEATVRLAGPSSSSNTIGYEKPESPNTYDARRRREVAAAEEALLGPLGLGFEDGSPTLRTIPRSSKPTRVAGFIPTSPNTPSKTRRGLFASATDEIDQVTPARTGGTGGIARDQWQIAADDLHELTEVFRGPRMHPVDVVSPEATEDEEEGSGGDREDSPPEYEGGAFWSPNDDELYEDDLVEDAAVEGDPIVSSSSPNVPLAEGSRVFQDLEMGNENVRQEADETPDLPKGAFKAPRFEDFEFGESSGAIVFTGSGNESSAPIEESGIFNFSSASSCLPTAAPELESAAASSVLGTSLAEDSPVAIAEANHQVPNEEASEVIEENGQAEALSANTQKSKKAKARAKKAQEKARKAEERKEAALQAKGPNRNQRRAASRERKAKEKKAQAEAKKAQSAAAKETERRREVATAMTGV